MIGIMLNGWLHGEDMDTGKTFLGALSALTLFITMAFFAPNLEIIPPRRPHPVRHTLGHLPNFDNQLRL